MRSHLDALSMVAGLEMGLTVWITAFIVKYRSEEDSNPAA